MAGGFSLKASLLALVLALPVFALVEHIYRIELDRAEASLRSEILQQSAAMRASLEGELNATLFLVTGLTGYVAAYDDFLESERVQTALEVIHAQNPHLRNVALAPDNIIQHVHPVQGNEAAIGLNYREVPHQWLAVERAMEAGSTVLAGPIELVQGGQGLVSRTPVFLDGGRYWGLLTLVIDSPALFADLGLEASTAVRFGLRWQRPAEERGRLICCDSAAFDADPVLHEIPVPGGSWQMAAAPVDGWQAGTLQLQWYRAGGHFFALIVAALIFLVLEERRRVARMALHDQLTGLPNRHAFKTLLRQRLQKAGRDGDSFALLYVDLDGFKAVNDHHGHGRGDEVLETLAKRMAATLSSGETIARVGGDEFIVLMPGIGDREKARQRIQPMVQAVRRPIEGLGPEEKLDASVGVAIYPDDGASAEALMQKADLSMYEGKRRARGEPINNA
jgi:diguanylate cyclase